MKKKLEISRENKNGKCINGERHSWRVEYGEIIVDNRFVYSVDKHTCVKCGEVKNISHKGLIAK